jgi:hypothetical protein
MTKSKVYGSYKDGSDIYKDNKGFYITMWNPKTNTDSKKYLKSLKKYVTSTLSKKKKTKKANKAKKAKKTKKKWGFF